MIGATPSAVPAGRSRALVLLALALFLAMTTWFSASAVLPQLRDRWDLGSTAASWLTISVQVGFVVGAVLSAMTNTADLVAPRRLILVGALGAAAANLGLLVAPNVGSALALRALTGAFLAAVYPPALKAMSTWFREGRGLALGVMVGALTLGSAAPHAINAAGGVSWRGVVVVTSVATVGGGILADRRVPDGPYPFPAAPFDIRRAWAAMRPPGVRLASLGYFGHMWELYAMWAWVGLFYAERLGSRGAGSLAAFVVIGIGAFGAVGAGKLSDQWGRSTITMLAMTASGGAALVVGFIASPFFAVVAGLWWGFGWSPTRPSSPPP